MVTFAAKNKGPVGDSIDYRVNYDSNNEFLPAGVSVAITTGVSGATDPDINDAIELYNPW